MSLSNSITIKPVSVSNIVFSFFLPDSSLHWGLFFQTGESQLILAASTPVGKASKANKKNNERFEMLVENLILLRSKLRNEKNYELSDQVRDILESSGLQIEDSEQGIQWKVTE